MAKENDLIENPPQDGECPNTREIFILGRNPEKKTAIFFNPVCGTWKCPICGDLRAQEWTHQAARGALLLESEGYQLQFVTLTSRAYATPNKSLYFFKQNFPNLRKRIAYYTNMWSEETGKKFAYFMVPERHKSGVLHAHLIAGTHIVSKVSWKHIAWQTGFGYILDVQPLINPLMVAEYVSKYLTKHIADAQWPKNFMHVRHSQNWPMSKPAPIEGWDWERYQSRDQALIDLADLRVNGWEVTDKARDK